MCSAQNIENQGGVFFISCSDDTRIGVELEGQKRGDLKGNLRVPLFLDLLTRLVPEKYGLALSYEVWIGTCRKCDLIFF